MSSGAIKRKTPTFGLNIINYDFPRWHTFDWQNWDTLDAVLKAANLTAVRGVWQNNTSYLVGDRVVDDASSSIWLCSVAHTSASSGTFAEARAANPSYWTAITSLPVDRGNWVTARQYNVWDIVKTNNAWYLCIAPHISGTFSTDLAAGKWALIFSVQPAIDAQVAAEAAQAAAETAETNAETAASTATTKASQASTSATNAATSATAASTSAGNASSSASAASGSASAAATSASNASTSASLAQSWAISLALVDGTYYGARKYAIDAANSAAAAATFNPALYLAKVGGVMTGNITFQDFVEGIVLAGGGKLVDQNTGGTSGNGRTLIFSNNDSMEFVTEDGNNSIFTIRYTDAAPTFKGNTVYHSGNYLPGYEKITSNNGAGTASSFFVTLPAGYKTFKLVLEYIRPTVDATLYLLLSNDGSTYPNTTGDYTWRGIYANASGVNKFDSDTQPSSVIVISPGTVSASGGRNNFIELDIEAGVAGYRPSIRWGVGIFTTSVQAPYFGSGEFGYSGRLMGVQIASSTGNLNYRYTLYGSK